MEWYLNYVLDLMSTLLNAYYIIFNVSKMYQLLYRVPDL